MQEAKIGTDQIDNTKPAEQASLGADVAVESVGTPIEQNVGDNNDSQGSNKTTDKKGQAPNVENKKEQASVSKDKFNFDDLDDNGKDAVLSKVDPDVLLNAIHKKVASLTPEQSEKLADTVLSNSKEKYLDSSDTEYNNLLGQAENYYNSQKALYDKLLNEAGVKNAVKEDGKLTKMAVATLMPYFTVQQNSLKPFNTQDSIFNPVGSVNVEKNAWPQNYHELPEKERMEIQYKIHNIKLI